MTKTKTHIRHPTTKEIHARLEVEVNRLYDKALVERDRQKRDNDKDVEMIWGVVKILQFMKDKGVTTRRHLDALDALGAMVKDAKEKYLAKEFEEMMRKP
jgi:hypothetical protein